MLNTVWKSDRAIGAASIWVVGLPIPRKTLNCSIHRRKKGKMDNTQMTPNTLKTKWAKAALLAVVLATIAARFAVTVVPMFSPKTMDAAISKLIHPLAHMTNVRAIVAEED